MLLEMSDNQETKTSSQCKFMNKRTGANCDVCGSLNDKFKGRLQQRLMIYRYMSNATINRI